MIADIVNSLSNLDDGALLWFNGLHCDLLDPVMLAATNKWLWIALAPLMAAWMVHKEGARKGITALLCLCVALAVCDQVCSSLLRPVVERLRPSNPGNPISAYVHIVGGYRSGPYGFPSAHAATTVAIVAFLSLYFRQRATTAGLAAWAVVICYSRVYLGVHYPGDILCGAAIGALAGSFAYLAYRGLTGARSPQRKKGLERRSSPMVVSPP